MTKDHRLKLSWFFLPGQELCCYLPDLAHTRVYGVGFLCCQVYKHALVLSLLLGHEIQLLPVYHNPQLVKKLQEAISVL